MNDEDLDTQALIERIGASYGVSTQRALAEVLGVPPNSISTWVQRNSFPGKAIIQCSLDTGADLNWLLTGKFSNSNLRDEPSLKGKALYDEIMASGGKSVLRRILDAYGFSMQKDLAELLDISSGTISTWIKRGYFPGDVVVSCALDTGVSLRWLATGKGDMFDVPSQGAATTKAISIPKQKLESGVLSDAGEWQMDAALSAVDKRFLVFIDGVSHSWLVNTDVKNVGNGRWVINIDNFYDVYDIARLPGGKLKLSNNSVSFDCNASDVTPFGAVLFTLEKNG
ncbi:repressor [Lonsdalea iberica]|uniref:Repressor n=1 Tax=Lonsdalea iberica TaxID=1082703 RepID=A0ABX3XBY2_9GAMM|nr:phage repressor protein CI [Lonsdalea iberica]OSN04713.1 repressor [Lonsdalea iberica]